MLQLSPSKSFSHFEVFIELHLLLLIASLYGSNLSTNGDFKKIENSKFLITKK